MRQEEHMILLNDLALKIQRSFKVYMVRVSVFRAF